MIQLRPVFSREQVKDREDLILRHVVKLLSEMQTMPRDLVPYFPIYGILD